MSNQGIRHRRWLLMLTAIGLGWVVATTVTVLGMFMTACRRRVKPETDDDVGLCHSSSLHEGYAMVGFGSLMNVALLVTMLVLLMKDRRKNRVKPDPPPDYESLIKDETPPPSYFELSLGDSDPPQDIVAVASPSAFSFSSPSSSYSSSSSSWPTPADTSGSTPPTTTSVSPPTPTPTTVPTGAPCTKSPSSEASLTASLEVYSNDLTIFL
ncbi:pectinesterase inhibitor 10-like [Penaeus monodon]|uniref:pectinesterase inhibitor 10-like n=1 Tax=Penaeus monodon TaxID=6687 RepID=UPI0018A751B1|nr:pectinesterase inhibitor 10-like [Penaeus monodon]